MEGYSVKINRSSKELSAKDRIRIKDTSNSISLDELTQGEGDVIIDYDYHVVLDVHNEMSDNKDYTKVVIADKAGTKYHTSSEAFLTALEEIVKEMTEAGEDDIQLSVYRKDSKNYKGKQFITCSIV